ncbi:PIG-U-domain-containing protein [Exidia glandulosa HHB12029]|uniref:PIG-U-domain-containing protein n=1 Tax=Exidia glandulosa HHB12029 TaxID=1314781 RepID=A0A165N4P5_EXIGL|nr:PIG-U-domain-containing protein [Exidia glandulosa HHB12029]
MESWITPSSLAILRVLVALAPLPDLSQFVHQLATPLTAFPRLKEGVFLYKNAINPYSGGPFRHSPIQLLLFSTILPTGPLAPLLWAAADILGAWCLVQIFRIRGGSIDASRERQIALFYLFNPYTFLSTTALSTSTFDNALYMLAVLFACKRRPAASMLALAVLTTSSLTSLLLLPPLALLLISSPKSGLLYPQPFTAKLQSTVPVVARYFAYLVALAAVSTLVVGDWSWVARTWGATLTLPDVTPNPGLWWYFFTEMFDHFRPFFLMVFSVHLIAYVAPICLKFQHDPLFATVVLQGLFATFKAYPSLADPGLFVNTIAIFPEVFPYLRHPVVTTMLHLYSSLLLVLFHNLWLVQGTGNANFYYASTMVFGLANGFAVTDLIWAGLRAAFGRIPDGWEVTQT